ncbi:MAG: sel1 repeat family protein [Treponema sp.]|jgi:TPR repeat protein|nr:sel1 repeat family protein [Treponema sp.]
MSRIDEIDSNHSAEEMYELGREYLDGMNGYSDDGSSETVTMPSTAIKYFAKAAQRGHVEAQFELARMYENGTGCEVDIKKAVEWYTAAASHDHHEAVNALKRLK